MPYRTVQLLARLALSPFLQFGGPHSLNNTTFIRSWEQIIDAVSDLVFPSTEIDTISPEYRGNYATGTSYLAPD